MSALESLFKSRKIAPCKYKQRIPTPANMFYSGNMAAFCRVIYFK